MKSSLIPNKNPAQKLNPEISLVSLWRKRGNNIFCPRNFLCKILQNFTLFNQNSRKGLKITIIDVVRMCTDIITKETAQNNNYKNEGVLRLYWGLLYYSYIEKHTRNNNKSTWWTFKIANLACDNVRLDDKKQ